MNAAAELGLDRFWKAKLSEGHRDARPFEQADHDFFTPARRHSGNSNVVAACGFGVDMTVQRKAFFSDVEGCHHLDAHHQAVVNPTRQLYCFLKQSIHTVSHASECPARLDVDVARPKSGGFRKDHPLDSHNRARVPGEFAHLASLDQSW